MKIQRINVNGMTFDIQEKDGKLEVHCLNRDKKLVMDYPIDQFSQSWYDWQVKGEYVQKAFDYMKADEREFLMTGITPTEWDELFKEDVDDETEGENPGNDNGTPN